MNEFLLNLLCSILCNANIHNRSTVANYCEIHVHCAVKFNLFNACFVIQSGENCQNCLSEENCQASFTKEDMIIRSQKLNESQEDAVLSNANMINCNHSNVKLIWGPPGTGKTKTVACLLFSLLKLKTRTLTCAPTNTAVLQVAIRLHRLVMDSLELETYGLGNIILFGNSKRMKLSSHPGLVDVFLDNRVENLKRCFDPNIGWETNLRSMIRLLKSMEKFAYKKKA